MYPYLYCKVSCKGIIYAKIHINMNMGDSMEQKEFDKLVSNGEQRWLKKANQVKTIIEYLLVFF